MTNKINQTYLLSIISLLLIGFYATVNYKYFSSDGANYLFTLLSTGELFSYQEGRVAAHYILKIPSWLLIKIGVKNFELISFSMGFSFYLQMILGIVFSFKALSQKNKIYILYPILSTFLFSLNTEYAIESESLFLNSFFWPVFFYIYEYKKINLSAILYIPLSIALAFSYETFCLVSLCLAFAIFKNKFIALKVKVSCYILLFIFSAFQFRNIIHHQHPGNVGRYIYSIKSGFFGLGSMHNNFFPYRNIYFVFIIVFFVYILIAATSNKIQKSKNLFFLCIIGIICLVVSYLYPTAVTRNAQFSTRSLTSIAPFIMIILFYFSVKMRESINYIFLSKCTSIIITFQVILSIITTIHWSEFNYNLNKLLNNKQGVVLVRDTFLQDKIIRGEIGINYLFWSLPLYSIFLDKDKTIDALLYAKNYYSDQMKLLEQIQSNKSTLEQYGFRMRLYDK
jgi:hypothetical protein